MTTYEIKVTAGIMIDCMAFLSMLSIPVLNKREYRNGKVFTTKPKTVRSNFYSITKQEIMDEYNRELGDNVKSFKSFEKLIKLRGLRYFKFNENEFDNYGVGLKKWCDEEIKQLGWVFAFYKEDHEIFQQMIQTIQETKLEQEV